MKRKMFFGHRRRKIGTVGAAACLVGIIAVIWVLSVFFDVCGIGRGREIMVNIPKGATAAQTAQILKEQGAVKHRFAFRVYEKFHRNGAVFRHGGHALKSNMSYAEIMEKLSAAPEVSFDEYVKVLIPEGYEIRQIADRLEDSGLINRDRFMKEVEKGSFEYGFIEAIKRKENRLEGYLFPATYEFAVGESEHSIINKMLKKFSDTVLPLYNSYSGNLTLDEIVTMASLVEREAANDGERRLVSSVFYNRLKADMTLSSCASVQYIIKERKKILSNSDVKIKSPYNTYINKGLPVGPIASPGEKSIKAAINPAQTDYYYFAARADGSENVFSKTGEEHMETVKRLQGK